MGQVSDLDFLEKSELGRGNSKCKIFEARVCKVCWRDPKESSVPGIQ